MDNLDECQAKANIIKIENKKKIFDLKRIITIMEI